MTVGRIEAVVTDFGGVLTTPLIESFARVQEAHGIPFEALGRAMVLAAERNGGVPPLFDLETGDITEQRFTELIGAALNEEMGREVDLGGFNEALFGALGTNEELLAFMRDLRGRGYRLAILTNNVREWSERWRAMLPIDELFEEVVDSAFVGMRKPDPRIYELLLERLGVRAEAAVFIDDLEVNCEAAAGLGMHAVRFRSTEQAIADVEALLDGGPPAGAGPDGAGDADAGAGAAS